MSRIGSRGSLATSGVQRSAARSSRPDTSSLGPGWFSGAYPARATPTIASSTPVSTMPPPVTATARSQPRMLASRTASLPFAPLLAARPGQYFPAPWLSKHRGARLSGLALGIENVLQEPRRPVKRVPVLFPVFPCFPTLGLRDQFHRRKHAGDCGHEPPTILPTDKDGGHATRRAALGFWRRASWGRPGSARVVLASRHRALGARPPRTFRTPRPRQDGRRRMVRKGSPRSMSPSSLVAVCLPRVSLADLIPARPRRQLGWWVTRRDASRARAVWLSLAHRWMTTKHRVRSTDARLARRSSRLAALSRLRRTDAEADSTPVRTARQRRALGPASGGPSLGMEARICTSRANPLRRWALPFARARVGPWISTRRARSCRNTIAACSPPAGPTAGSSRAQYS